MGNMEAHARPACISMEAFKQITPGDIITYVLPAHMQPTNPRKEWHGRVEGVGEAGVLVSSLEEGYYGETETVMRTEIISVATGAAS